MFELYIENLNTNEGEWISLPRSDSDISEILKNLGIIDETGKIISEYKISDWLDFEGTLETPNDFDIYELNNIALKLSKFSESEVELFWIFAQHYNMEKAIKIIEDKNYAIYPNCDNDYDLGYQLVEAAGGINCLPEETLKEFFNYESYAQSVELNSIFVYKYNPYTNNYDYIQVFQ